MMSEPMKLSKARAMAAAIAVGRRKFGAQYSPPYPAYEIIEALVVLNEQATAESSEIVAQMKEQLTAANRRAGAAESRLKRMLKRNGETEPADVSNDTLRQED